MTEYRNEMTLMIDRMKTKEKELKQENQELQQQVTMNWTLQSITWMLEGELTMEKWDKLAMLLQDQGLTEFLNNIYTNVD